MEEKERKIDEKEISKGKRRNQKEVQRKKEKKIGKRNKERNWEVNSKT